MEYKIFYQRSLHLVFYLSKGKRIIMRAHDETLYNFHFNHLICLAFFFGLLCAFFSLFTI